MIVMTRATLYLNTIGGDGAVVETDKEVKDFLFGSHWKNLLILDAVPKEVKSQPLAEKKALDEKPTGLGASPSGPTSTVDAYEKMLSSIPEFSEFGKLFKVLPQAPVELTEAETEYAVNVVFQHNCTNTIPEQLLENVTVIVDASEAEEFSERRRWVECEKEMGSVKEELVSIKGYLFELREWMRLKEEREASISRDKAR
ncbi:hypothetical protein Pint_33647 [Pistacia integerrima]|uniref:Uncharacterized protein n=1 Tax=Pistacia integerrima TaxID=434235 RepID=A0ACC0X8W1_9ROSI|nr:hypothetical protein Pint_33647 [Pistacia integerrima]